MPPTGHASGGTAPDTRGDAGGSGNPPSLDKAADGLPPGVETGWCGPFETFVDRMGLSESLAARVLKSARSDDEGGLVEVSQRQRFITAECGWRNLRKVAAETE